jgi:hypothetical protein
MFDDEWEEYEDEVLEEYEIPDDEEMDAMNLDEVYAGPEFNDKDEEEEEETEGDGDDT